MKIAILSDIHANLEAFRAVLEDMRAMDCARAFCCGDVVGYGGNPNECCQLVREHRIQPVRGNHDEAVALDFPLLVERFNPAAATSVRWSREHTTVENREWLSKLPLVHVEPEFGFTLCHSTLAEPSNWAYLTTPAMAAAAMACMKTDVCFIGHSHAGAVFFKESDGHVSMLPPCPVRLSKRERYVINVGSVGQPRDYDNRASYFIYDFAEGLITPRRVKYSVAAAQEKIRKAGLPESLASRLAFGQ